MQRFTLIPLLVSVAICDPQSVTLTPADPTVIIDGTTLRNQTSFAIEACANCTMFFLPRFVNQSATNFMVRDARNNTFVSTQKLPLLILFVGRTVIDLAANAQWEFTLLFNLYERTLDDIVASSTKYMFFVPPDGNNYALPITGNRLYPTIATFVPVPGYKASFLVSVAELKAGCTAALYAGGLPSESAMAPYFMLLFTADDALSQAVNLVLVPGVTFVISGTCNATINVRHVDKTDFQITSDEMTGFISSNNFPGRVQHAQNPVTPLKVTYTLKDVSTVSVNIREFASPGNLQIQLDNQVVQNLTSSATNVTISGIAQNFSISYSPAQKDSVFLAVFKTFGANDTVRTTTLATVTKAANQFSTKIGLIICWMLLINI